jgi:hypothetical protein
MVSSEKEWIPTSEEPEEVFEAESFGSLLILLSSTTPKLGVKRKEKRKERQQRSR